MSILRYTSTIPCQYRVYDINDFFPNTPSPIPTAYAERAILYRKIYTRLNIAICQHPLYEEYFEGLMKERKKKAYTTMRAKTCLKNILVLGLIIASEPSARYRDAYYNSFAALLHYNGWASMKLWWLSIEPLIVNVAVDDRERVGGIGCPLGYRLVRSLHEALSLEYGPLTQREYDLIDETVEMFGNPECQLLVRLSPPSTPTSAPRRLSTPPPVVVASPSSSSTSASSRSSASPSPRRSPNSRRNSSPASSRPRSVNRRRDLKIKSSPSTPRRPQSSPLRSVKKESPSSARRLFGEMLRAEGKPLDDLVKAYNSSPARRSREILATRTEAMKSPIWDRL
ncbi:hypothetical protein JCM5353_003046 [Sporobolomyces roseus]